MFKLTSQASVTSEAFLGAVESNQAPAALITTRLNLEWIPCGHSFRSTWPVSVNAVLLLSALTRAMK